MIAVIADDFTGAAELGGIGLRYGLKVELNTVVNPASEADVLIIATDTRSMPQADALATMRQVTAQMAKLKPELIFKKVDSVLRGYVAQEIGVQLEVLNLNQALLVPANPAMGRTINQGVYYLNNEPLHQTKFATDPEFPVLHADVYSRLAGKGLDVHSIRSDQSVLLQGITIGDATNDEDLNHWAKQADGKAFVAGASGFFNAILQSRGYGLKDAITDQPELNRPMLIVSGTAFTHNNPIFADNDQPNLRVSLMPLAVMLATNANDIVHAEWCAQIIASLINFGKAIIAIDPQLVNQYKIGAVTLREKTALVVQKVFEQVLVTELIVEGGSTASAIFDRLDLHQFYPMHEFATGIIRMKAYKNAQLCVTLKPGSYAWPDALTKHSIY